MERHVLLDDTRRALAAVHDDLGTVMDQIYEGNDQQAAEGLKMLRENIRSFLDGTGTHGPEVN